MGKLLIAIGLGLICSEALAAEEIGSAESRSRLLPGAVPGTLRFAGSQTSFGIGGRLETHATVSDVYFSASQAGRDRLRFGQIPVVSTSEEDNQFRFNSRESRLWFQLQRPVQDRDLNVYVEYDMTKSPDQYRLFLRHAYASWGPLLAGRSYTTFVESATLPDVDSGSAPGEVFLKRDQVRWTQRYREDSLELALAIEESDSLINDSQTSAIQKTEDGQRPALVSRLTWRQVWGQLSVSGMLRSLRWQQNGQRLSSLTGGVGFSGRIQLHGIDNIRFMTHYGNGLGRFITVGAYADASVATDFSELNPHPVFSALAAYQHFWNTEWRSTFSLSLSRSSLPDSANRELTEAARSVQANLIWSPVPELNIGVEYLHGHRQLLNQQDGELNRLMFSARYTIQW